MQMAFEDFKYPDVLREFELVWRSVEDMFAGMPAVTPIPAFRDTMNMTARLAATVNTEKARSEWMIAPLLGDFWSRYHAQISLFSGADFDADPASRLTGYDVYCRPTTGHSGRGLREHGTPQHQFGFVGHGCADRD
jgi:hypothetical protein